MPLKMQNNMRQSFPAFAAKAFGSVFALFLLTLSSAYAAGLGKLTVLSALGQPLRAEIELTAVAKGEEDNIVVKLATHDDYKKANLDYTSALSSLRFNIEKRGVRHVVRVSSAQPLNEPFVGMLLELRSSSVRLTREYTFLLDPADMRSSAPAVTAGPTRVQQVVKPVAEPAASAPDEISARAKTIKAKSDHADKPEPKQAAAKSKDDKSGASQHKIKNGETLAVVAKKYKYDDVTLEQMLVSIYQTNPDAFVGKNMNRMRVGRVLNVPDAETAGAVTKAEARKVIVAQASDFASYRNKLAEQAAQAAPQETEGGQAAGGKIGAKVEEKAAATKSAQDKLKLSKASGKAAKAQGGVVGAEDKAAKDKAAAEERARVKELEKNVSDLQGVIDAKNKQLAAQQKQAADSAAAKQAADAAATKKAADDAAAKQAADAAAAKKAADDAAAKKAADDAAAAKQASASVPPGAASVPPGAASVPAGASVPAKPAVKRVPPPPPPPQPEPSFFDDLLDNPIMLGGIALAVLLIAYIAVRSRAKKKSPPPATVAGSMVTDNRDAPNSLFGSSGGQSVDTNNSIFNSGFTPSASLLDANEVDPVAEADVYIAYGREAQAIEILKEALRSHPERNALRIKLLEIYASQKDVHAFDLLAGELYGLTHGEGEEWVYVAGLGIAIDPTNPLYAGGDMSEELLERPTSLQGSMTQPAPEHDPEAHLEKPRTSDVPMMAVDEFIQPTRDQIENPDLPLDLGAPATGKDDAIDFAALAAAPPPLTQPAPLEFDLNLPVEQPAEHKATEELAALDFDLGDFGVKNDAPADTVPTAGLAVSEASDADLAQVVEFQPQTNSAPLPELDLDAQLAAADRELAAIDQVEPYVVATVVAEPASSSQPVEPAAAPAEFDFGGINLELESQQKPAAASSGSAEMDTKIELAAAYLGIGDKEGARELLEEVIQEGAPEQIEKARQALAKIS